MASLSSDDALFGDLHPDIAHLATADRSTRKAVILTTAGLATRRRRMRFNGCSISLKCRLGCECHRCCLGGPRAFGSDEAKALIESDPHLEERFEIVALPAWTKKEKWVVEPVRERLRLIPLRKPTTVDRELTSTSLGRSVIHFGFRRVLCLGGLSLRGGFGFIVFERWADAMSIATR